MMKLRLFFSLLILLSISGRCLSWSFFSSSATSQEKEKASGDYNERRRPWRGGDVVEFSVEGLKDDMKAIELVAKAERKMIGSTDSCWSNAYKSLFKGCSEIGTSKELQYRLAWQLTNCYQEDAGAPLPPCDDKTTMMKCRQKLNADESARFAAYFLVRNSKDILESLTSVDVRTKQLEETSKNVENHVDIVLKHSELVYEQSKGIAAAQVDLK